MVTLGESDKIYCDLSCRIFRFWRKGSGNSFKKVLIMINGTELDPQEFAIFYRQVANTTPNRFGHIITPKQFLEIFDDPEYKLTITKPEHI